MTIIINANITTTVLAMNKLFACAGKKFPVLIALSSLIDELVAIKRKV